VIHKITVDLPKKHGRGGQSAVRFARLRLEKRQNYVRKVAELATSFFILNDKPIITGLVLAGSADFKSELSKSDLFDYRLRPLVLKIVDVAYGGENGFNQAIELSAESLASVKFIQEKKIIGKYFEEISQDTGKYVFGVSDTMKALEMGAVDILLMWENLGFTRYVVRCAADLADENRIMYLSDEQEKDSSHFKDEASGSTLEVIEKDPLTEWMANNYKKFGCQLEFVTNRSQEGSQFCKGFGGIGGLLRYRIDFEELHVEGEYEGDDSDEEEDSDDDYDGDWAL